MSEFITFEQPLSETLRLCLRLEHLLTQVYLKPDEYQPSRLRNAVVALARILNVTDRSDLKTKFVQLIVQLSTSLEPLIKNAQVDVQKLEVVLQKLGEHQANLQNLNGRFGDRLRAVPLLSQISSRLSSLAGVCDFACPAFALWLQQQPIQRDAVFQQWSSELSLMNELVHYLLHLMRQSTPSSQVFADNGYYQQALEASLPYQLVRVSLPIDQQLYPDISVGRHRLSIRFHSAEYGDQSTVATPEKFPFKLTLCKI